MAEDPKTTIKKDTIGKDTGKSEIKPDSVLSPISKSPSSVFLRERRRLSQAISSSVSTPKNKTVTTLVLTIAVVGLLFLVAIAPALSSITSQLETNNLLTQRIEKLQSKQQQLLTLTSAENNSKDKLKKFDGYFSESKHEAEIYKDLLDYANSSSLKFSSFTTNQNTTQVQKYVSLGLNPKTRLLNISVSLSGTLDNITKYINLVESNPRILDIASTGISVIDQNNPSLKQLDMLLYVFYWGQPLE